MQSVALSNIKAIHSTADKERLQYRLNSEWRHYIFALSQIWPHFGTKSYTSAEETMWSEVPTGVYRVVL